MTKDCIVRRYRLTPKPSSSGATEDPVSVTEVGPPRGGFPGPAAFESASAEEAAKAKLKKNIIEANEARCLHTIASGMRKSKCMCVVEDGATGSRSRAFHVPIDVLFVKTNDKSTCRAVGTIHIEITEFRGKCFNWVQGLISQDPELH